MQHFFEFIVFVSSWSSACICRDLRCPWPLFFNSVFMSLATAQCMCSSSSSSMLIGRAPTCIGVCRCSACQSIEASSNNIFIGPQTCFLNLKLFKNHLTYLSNMPTTAAQLSVVLVWDRIRFTNHGLTSPVTVQYCWLTAADAETSWKQENCIVQVSQFCYGSL